MTATATSVAISPAQRMMLMGKAALKSLAVSGLLALVSIGGSLMSPYLGAMVLFIGSLAMMINNYRRPWRLNWLTGLIPPAMALLSIVIQLLFFFNTIALPNGFLALLMIGCGLLIGLWRGLVHKVFWGDKGLMAERTTWYLLVWAVSFIFTQFLGIAKLTGMLPFGLLTNFFTTTMLITVSMLLFARGLFLKAPEGQAV